VKITDVRVFELEGPLRSGLALYEIPRGGLEPYQATPYRQRFTEIETDEGVTGLTLGGSDQVKALGQSLIGEDPMRVEHIWDRFYTESYQRVQVLRSLSTLDLALWDLIGKAVGEPVYHLLGGPCQPRIRAYAAMLGFSTEPAAAAERSLEWVEKGYTALKWYIPYNEGAGAEGLAHNVAMIRAVRDAVGDDVDIMIDCILSGSAGNSLFYAIKLARRLEPYAPTWLEEPLNPYDLEAYARLAAATSIPLAFGERLYARWQYVDALNSRAPTVLQPELMAIGGITEMRKLAVLIATYGLHLVPHANESGRCALHLLFAHPRRTCPLAEWGVRINHNVQFFYRDFYQPVNGYYELPAGPGFGYELDPDKIVQRTEL
jgi:L-alanine-DL-glutamate epimerase-like enolase superfamily enzyme